MSFLYFILRTTVLGVLGGLWLAAGIYLYLSPNLPDVETLRDVRLQTPMRVYTREGDLIGQFGEQKRSPLRYEQIPQQFVLALLAAEDDGFFEHRGIDIMGLARAVSELVITGEKGSGGSTLTMQVARNYFLTLEKTFMRKFNEILLAIEIERALTKPEIFELYVNRVFLGHRAYGFEAASQVYYGKSIGELTLAQHAMLAGIPKAPSRNNPVSGPTQGSDRRNWILGRMAELGFITVEERAMASAAPVTAELHGAQIAFSAQYAAEMARQEMLDRFGMAAYNDGYHVYTTISRPLQQVARRAVTEGLLTYDARHGYRGPEQRWPLPEDSTQPARDYWLQKLNRIPPIAERIPAVVTALLEDRASLLLADGSSSELLWENGPSAARPYITEDRTGPAPTTVADLFTPGDLVRLLPNEEGAWQLAQIPAAQAALVSLEPDDGAIVSIVGGMGFELSKFNRATQAQRQPGSSFKPFLYGAALEAGFTAASIINDAPVVMQDSSLEDAWRPENDGGSFHGPTRLRWALTKSRNLVSIRLLQQLGVRNFIEAVDRYGFDTSDFSPDLSLALGTHAMTPLQIATGYAMLANGGYRVEPYLIDRVENINGEVVHQSRPLTVCATCSERAETAQADEELSMEQILSAGGPNTATPSGETAGTATDQAQPPPAAPRVMDERVNFILNSMLADVIKRGTARKARVLERSDLAGKTGTTNGPMDAWFSGYSPSIVTTTWVGFDSYTPLGRREFGGTAALPIWIAYMREALKDSPQKQATVPAGVVNVRIDPESGALAGSRQNNAIFEYFRTERVPQAEPGADGSNGAAQGTEDLVRDIF